MKDLKRGTEVSTTMRFGLLILVAVIGLLLTLTVVVAQSGPNFEESYKSGPRYARQGGAITYTIVAANAGGTRADSVVLSDTLPSWAVVISGSCTYDDGYETDNCGPLNNMWEQNITLWPGTRITTTFAVTLTSVTNTIGLPLINYAYLSWDGGQKEMSWTTTLNPAYVYMPFVLHSFPPSWKQGGNTDNIRFYTPSGCGDETWYAGTPDSGVAGVWKSINSIQTWDKIVALSPYPYPLVANPNNCNQAFVAVWGPGIYRITGGSVQPINDGLGETYLYGLAITGTTLYAGTNSQGVHRTDINDISWKAVNTNITEQRIRSLTVIGDRVYAGARACTLYTSDNRGDSWSKQVILTNGCDDAQVWSIAVAKAVLYVGLQNKGLYYNAGSGWIKLNAIPNQTVYGLAYDSANDRLYVSTYGSGIYYCSVDGAGMVQACEQYNTGLTTLNMREIKIHNELLVAGSDDGIWYLPLSW